MSWENDTLQVLAQALRSDGRVVALGVKERSVSIGIEEGFPDDIGTNMFPVIRLTWANTNETNEESDDAEGRYITMNMNVTVGVKEHDATKRLATLSDLVEKVKNAIYSFEHSTSVKHDGLVLDEIDIGRVEVVPDVLMAPYGLAVMDVALKTWSDRDDRKGVQ